MTVVHMNLFNFSGSEILGQIFPVSDEYEFTAKNVFRRKFPPVCECGCVCNYNGYNYARKRGFGKVRVGKYLCPACDESYEEDKGFWKKLLGEWKETIQGLFMVLRDSSVSYQAISNIMNFIMPLGEGSVFTWFQDCMNKVDCLKTEDVAGILIIHYDEQHPKKGRTQKFRLTLLNAKDKTVIAEGLFDDKQSETIKRFLLEHLDVKKELVIVTDCDLAYPEIFKELWGNRVRHQKCLLHLNKLVSKDFGKNTSLVDEYNKYLIFNTFYDRTKELKKLAKLIKKMEQQKFENKKERRDWINKTKKEFYEYVRKLENKRRRKKQNHKQWSLKQATKNFQKLWTQKSLFPKKAQKRLKMIKDNWTKLTTFYHVEGCPATNNAIENYYSTSLKTHRKKQFRTEQGILNQMKLSAYKRKNDITKPKQTIFELINKILLITT